LGFRKTRRLQVQIQERLDEAERGGDQEHVNGNPFGSGGPLRSPHDLL
jgi:hypothetical protein